MGIQRYKPAATTPLLIVDDLAFEVRESSRRKTLEITVDRDGELIIAAPATGPTPG